MLPGIPKIASIFTILIIRRPSTAFSSIGYSTVTINLQHKSNHHCLLQTAVPIMAKTNGHEQRQTRSVSNIKVNLRRGILQGDAVSALFFCIALSLLSIAVNNLKTGFVIVSDVNFTHPTYMDN